jgi:hypothetical protein
MLKMELSRLKGKGHVQPSQDNRDHKVKKLEKGSSVTCAKLSQINLKTSYQKIDKPKIKKKAQVKCFEFSSLGHFLFVTRKVIKQSPLDVTPKKEKNNNIERGSRVDQKI